MKLKQLNILFLLFITIFVLRGQMKGQICDDWKSQSTAYVVTGSTPEDPSFYQWEQKSNNMHGVHLCLLNADVIPVYIQQQNNYINFTTRFGPSTALLYMLQVEVNVNDNGYSTIYSGSAKQDVVWFNSSSAFPDCKDYDLKVRVTFFDGTIRYRQYKVKVIPPSQTLFKDNVGNTLRKWNGNNPYLKKAIVFSEGFDAYNTNGQEMYYHAAADLIECLNAHGYDVFLLDNFFGTQDIRNNAAVFASAVRYISSLYNHELLVAGGVSMGGLISRYAMAKAEDIGDPLPVHTYITIDSPHQGAVVSEPLQNFKKSNEADDEFAKYALSNIAARQMLYYNAYDPDGSTHESFYQELNGLNGDGYPHLTKNIGVSFSTANPNPNTGGWYKITYHTGPISGTIKTFDLTQAEKAAGSWLPKDLTSMSPIIKQASYWWLQLLVPGITPLYYPTIEFERFTDPSYIPYESAFDIRNNQSPFDVCLEPESTTWHDVLPADLIEPIVNEIIKTDIYYQNRELYFPWAINGNKVEVGNQVTSLFPHGDVNVYPGGALHVEASECIKLKNGVSVKYGGTAHFVANPDKYYECWNISKGSLPGTSMKGSESNLHNVNIISNEKVANGFDIRIFPNPAHHEINILCDCNLGKEIKVEVMNIHGIVVKTSHIQGMTKQRIDIQHLPGGYYFVHITDGVYYKTLPFVKK
jgi:hypothetical protein